MVSPIAVCLTGSGKSSPLTGTNRRRLLTKRAPRYFVDHVSSTVGRIALIVRTVSEGELHRNLNDPGTRAEGEHFSKIDGADIANGIVSVRVIENVENIRTELKGCSLAD